MIYNIDKDDLGYLELTNNIIEILSLGGIYMNLNKKIIALLIVVGIIALITLILIIMYFFGYRMI
ncbi:hypothetical protein Ccar_22405 [Clostridium carboxidivorans P7]|uniref:Uncharacterized protein n=1 Tax=Clostridium carboxidivorans P7 TaxID=536227 RepID=C6PS64_9CLOT|nr:hypothetical protein Ccar_22405 [Clostridium carboxidivorans P7]EET87861.1 hypothetical protein CcarbDRAFT_1631 [Clostridium carboxidivorans P7]EFG89191.1 hypothetical protein CLCAR_1068 [Clostridium carboxidivorans P7]